MKKAAILLTLTISMAVTSSCSRNGCEVWQDTKTAKRHMRCAWNSLRGNKQPSRQIHSEEQFAGVVEEEFIPLNDEDLYTKIAMGDPQTLRAIDYDTAIPASRVRAGEVGSGVPGIDGFHTPQTSQEQKAFKTIHFEFDSYAIHGEENMKIAKSIAKFMKKRPNTYVFVEGHCDQQGPAAYNLALGSRRATALRNLLIKEGVHPDHLLTVSYGLERLLNQHDDAKSRRQNRRDQFKLYSS